MKPRRHSNLNNGAVTGLVQSAGQGGFVANVCSVLRLFPFSHDALSDHGREAERGNSSPAPFCAYSPAVVGIPAVEKRGDSSTGAPGVAPHSFIAFAVPPFCGIAGVDFAYGLFSFSRLLRQINNLGSQFSNVFRFAVHSVLSHRAHSVGSLRCNQQSTDGKARCTLKTSTRNP